MNTYQRICIDGADAARRSTLAALRAFYCDVLGGRQVRRTRPGDGSSALTFLVGRELVTTSPGVAGDRITLLVEDAAAIAERCWDAGFTVRVRGAVDAATIVVIDPFGREVELISSAEARGVG